MCFMRGYGVHRHYIIMTWHPYFPLRLPQQQTNLICWFQNIIIPHCFENAIQVQKKMAVEDIKNVHFAQNLNSSTAGEKIVAVFISSWCYPSADFLKRFHYKLQQQTSQYTIFLLFHFYSDLLDDHLGTRAWPNETHFEYKVILHHHNHSPFTFVCWLSAAAVCVQNIYIFKYTKKNSRFLMENDDDKEDKEAE